MLATPAGRRTGLAWAKTLQGDRTPIMKGFITDATSLAMARQRAMTGRDPQALDGERALQLPRAADGAPQRRLRRCCSVLNGCAH